MMDGNSDTFTYDTSEPPLSLQGTANELINPYFEPVSRVPASPFMQKCELDGTTVAATFSGPLPANDISLQPAVYALTFTLVYGE
jgi:hypothetical protein